MKLEQGKLGLNLKNSVCSMDRFIGGGLRGRPIWKDFPWTGVSRPLPRKMQLRLGRGVTAGTSVMVKYAYMKEEIKSSKL